MWKSVLIFVLLINPLQAFGEGAVGRTIDSGVTISALKERQYTSELVFEKYLYQRDKIRGDLYSFQSDGLKIYALVNTPKINTSKNVKPKGGYPVLIYGHGFHPEPRKYGVTNDGETSRPGDYYRGIPERYAQAGYVVVTPDYRGHNQSQGFKFTQRPHLTTSYYAIDVLHLLAAIPGLADINTNRIFYAGHSMGGEVGLKVLISAGEIRAASLWSPAVGSAYQSKLYYGHLYDEEPGSAVNASKLQNYRQKMDKSYADLHDAITPIDVDAINHVQHTSTPILIQHARGDQSVPYAWAENLVIELDKYDKDFLFYSYDTDNHLFQGANRELAFERDLKFFDDN